MSVIVKSGGGSAKQEKTVTAGTYVKEVLPDTGKLLSKVVVNPTPTEEKTVTPTTSQQTVSPSEGKHLAKVIVNAMEDVTPEVTAQTPIIAEILSNLGFTADTASGTNKQKLQTNNTNLAKIEDYLPHGAYVWKKYNYSIKSSIVANNQDLDSDGFYIYNSDDYQVTASDFSLSTLDGGKTVGTSQTIYFTYTDKLYWSYTKGGTDDYQYRVNTNSDNLLIVATNYSCNFTGLTGIEFAEPSIGDFVDFVVSDQSTAYPDSGTQDGYWYERFVEKENGIFINAYNSSNQPTDVLIKHNSGTPYNFLTSGAWNALENIELDAPSIGKYAITVLNNLNGKLKLKNVVSIDEYAFQNIGKTSGTNAKVFIPATCETIITSGMTTGPFENNTKKINIYCEAASQPSGWGAYWNWVGSGYGTHNILWGVSESEFDAL